MIMSFTKKLCITNAGRVRSQGVCTPWRQHFGVHSRREGWDFGPLSQFGLQHSLYQTKWGRISIARFKHFEDRSRKWIVNICKMCCRLTLKHIMICYSFKSTILMQENVLRKAFFSSNSHLNLTNVETSQHHYRGRSHPPIYFPFPPLVFPFY